MSKSKDKFKSDKTESKKDDFKKGSAKRSNPRPKRGKDWHADETKEGRNDVSWYVPDTQLLNDAGRWPYSRPVGTPLNRRSIIGIADAEDNAVPGICASSVALTFGVSDNGQSALNVAANAVYTYVRHVNSGSRNYDANDLMLYIMALDSVYSFVTFITRAYATVGMYAQMNKYLPEALGRAQYVDLESIRTNMANFRARFNDKLLKIGTLIVPDSMPIFKRHAAIFQNYYSEGPSIKDQIYFYYPENFYKFQLDSSGAGMLKNVSISEYFNANGLLDANGIIRIMDDMITPIFNDEDFNIMSGDILKAYDGRIMSLMLIPDLLIAQPINNIVFLEQFKNQRIIPTINNSTLPILDVTQDANKEFLLTNFSDLALFLVYGSAKGAHVNSAQASDPDRYRFAYDEWSRALLLTTEVSDPTPEINMVNTRMVACPEISVDASKPSGLDISEFTVGSEFSTQVEYWYYAKNWVLSKWTLFTVQMFDSANITDVATVSRIRNTIAPFRFHPAHAFIGIDTSTSPITYVCEGMPDLGVDNFTTIDFAHVQALNDVAILGEFNVPRLAVVK